MKDIRLEHTQNRSLENLTKNINREETDIFPFNLKVDVPPRSRVYMQSFKASDYELVLMENAYYTNLTEGIVTGTNAREFFPEPIAHVRIVIMPFS
ncbi:hypothetical protein WAG19_29090 [Bacillus cereus]|uniref:hypothetical protein n=1 Tax=Bacillus cereus TaxID=1396 RepID=UPI003012BD81